MISYTGIEINGDYSKLMGNHPTTGERLISEKHIDNVVIETFNKYLGDLISKIIIEWPYYDQDYLSTYYLHYAKKFRKFSQVLLSTSFYIAEGRLLWIYSITPCYVWKKVR